MKIQSFIEELGLSQPKVVDITRSQRKFFFHYLSVLKSLFMKAYFLLQKLPKRLRNVV